MIVVTMPPMPTQNPAGLSLRAVAELRRVGREVYRLPGAVGTAPSAEPEALAVGVLLSLTPAMRDEPSLAEKS